MPSTTVQAPPTSPSPATQPAPVAALPAPASHPSRAARWVIWCAVTALLIAAAYFGAHWWSYRGSHSITEDAFVEAHIVNVAPEMVSGRLIRFLVEENDQVEQDQVLAEIEPIHYRDQVEQARGKLDLAEA